jgi:hypothetical protein
MAEDASRRWALNDDELLTYSNSTYPQTPKLVVTLPFEKASELQDDLHAMPAEIAHGVCPSRVVQANNTWKVWAKFCQPILPEA